MQTDSSNVREGMTVFSSDGEKLGKVLSCDVSSFTIEKGFFFPQDYIVRYEEVAAVTDDDIRLAVTKDTFVEARERDASGYGLTSPSSPAESTETSPTGESMGTSRMSSGEDIRVPVTEEELDIVKHDREAGVVRLRKDVITETKHFEVPVTREEVHVERARVSEQREALPGDKPFEKDTISMAIHEEEVEIRKRPVVKEVVRVRKERVTEQRASEADVRKERVEVEGDYSESGVRRDPT